MTFAPVIALDALWAGEPTGLRVGGVKVLLVRLGADVHAYEDRCAHLGVELSRGSLADGVLTCSAHEWTYDVATGASINPRGVCLRRFPVKVEAGQVFVDVDGGSR